MLVSPLSHPLLAPLPPPGVFCVFRREIFSQERTWRCVYVAAKSQRVTMSTEQPRFQLNGAAHDNRRRVPPRFILGGASSSTGKEWCGPLSPSRALAIVNRDYMCDFVADGTEINGGWAGPSLPFAAYEFPLDSEISLNAKYKSFGIRDRMRRRIPGEIRRFSAILEFKCYTIYV